MKRGPLHFLGRKNNSLFDTNIKIKDMDNVELVLESSAIPESGTASVRARPTVKHHSSSSLDSFQGYAVPTPKVPLLPPANGPKLNGLASADRLSNGSVLSVPDLVEGELVVPPPPSMAPPPPPSFIPPPDFMGDLNDLPNLQPPSIPAPKVTSLAPSVGGEDLTFLKPPPMVPPKPPSTCSSGSASSISVSSPPVPEHPKFAPPQPPLEKQQKTYKTPPPKPIRLSSISNLDSPPQTPAPPPPVQTPTLSTFNPQNTAKLYNVPKTSILGGYEDRDTKPKHQMLVLEDSAPVPVQVDGKAPKVVTPSKPVPKDVQEVKENVQITQPSPSPLPEPNKEAKAETVSAPPAIDKPLRTTHQTLPQLPKVNSTPEPIKDKVEVSPGQVKRFSPLLDRKLRNLKNSETNGAREGHVASPLALLMAAKERDKHRSTHSLSRENSSNNNEQPSTSIQPSETSPNSFIVTPRPSSSSSLTSQDMIQESPKPARLVEHPQTIQTPQKPSSPALVKNQTPFKSPNLNRMVVSPSLPNLAAPKQNTEQSPLKPQPKQVAANKEEFGMPLLPPPPEFDDLDSIMDPPPSMPPPDPPKKKAPAPSVTSPPPPHSPPAQAPPPPPTHVPPPPPAQVPPPPPAQVPPPPPAQVPPPPPAQVPPPPPVQVPPPPPAKVVLPPPPPPPPPAQVLPPPPPVQIPSPSPKHKVPAPPPAPPKLPPPDVDAKPKPQVQTKPKAIPSHIPSNLSPSQATLLSILQKKMLEMDHKMAPVKEAESSSDDWGAPASDDDNKVPVVPRATPQTKNVPVVNKSATLDLRELEGKVAKKYQETSSVKVPTTSNGPSKHKYGMTFTVRPGTKQPITLVSKGDPL